MDARIILKREEKNICCTEQHRISGAIGLSGRPAGRESTGVSGSYL